MNDQEVRINTPKNLSHFAGQFVLFFSEEADPQVLFNSYIGEEAYKKAEELKEKFGKTPVVFRVQENINNTISHIAL